MRRLSTSTACRASEPDAVSIARTPRGNWHARASAAARPRLAAQPARRSLRHSVQQTQTSRVPRGLQVARGVTRGEIGKARDREYPFIGPYDGKCEILGPRECLSLSHQRPARLTRRDC